MEVENGIAEADDGNELRPICGDDGDLDNYHVLLDVSAHLLA